ncbi:MAG: Flp1 family type IVb pilin [Eubacteriales bacterium]|nr:Flp1 family type IVb pilin [Eubacteriales bacterium]
MSGTARRGKILSDFLSDEEGVGTIEIVLILVVLIGLVIIFKNQLNTLIGNIFRQIESLSESVY